MSDQERFFYPSRIGRIILRSMEDLVGEEKTAEILRTADLEQYIGQYPPSDFERSFPFEHVSGLQVAVEKLYGPEEGRELSRQIGRLCLNNGLREFNPILGIADLPVRMMPLSLKFHVGFDMFKMVFNRFSDQVVSLSEDNQYYYWIIERCPVCWGRKTDAPCCHLAVGILEESITWATGGKVFAVEEISCIAQGDETCTIAISRRPL